MGSGNSKIGKTSSWIHSASDVVARLHSGNMSASEEKEIESWLDENESNRVEFDRALTTWDNMEALSGRPELLAIGEPPEPLYSRLRNGKIAGIAVAATVVVGILATFSPGFSFIESLISTTETTYETQVGERRTVALPDGSDVMLNTNSRIRVNFTRKERNVVLEYGEAFFDVRKDQDRPLRVAAGSSRVKVLGTKFSVHWSGPNVTIAVVEGLVAVRPNVPSAETDNQRLMEQEDANDSDVLLESGSIAVFSEERKSIEKDYTAQLDDLQSWRFGFIRFDDDPLFKVIGVINRYSKTPISIEDKDIMDMPISGVFTLDDVDKILAGLEAVNPIDVTRRFDGYTIVGRKAAGEM